MSSIPSRWLLLAASMTVACASGAGDSDAVPGPSTTTSATSVDTGEPPLDDESSSTSTSGDPEPPTGETTSTEQPLDCPFEIGSQPQKKALFIDLFPDKDLELEEELIRLTQAAKPGSEIRVSIFTFTRVPVAEALLEAAGRGVKVDVVVDEKNTFEESPGSGWRYTTPVQMLLDELGPEHVIMCNADVPPNGGGCQGTGINHNKFVLFSELCDGSKDVVVQSSANFTNPQLEEHNNMVIIRDDPGLYLAYKDYFADLQAQLVTNDAYVTATGSTDTRAYFFPRAGGTAEPSTDTVHQLLRAVDCAEGTRVRVAMAFWTQGRGYIVDDLALLQNQGCDVKVAVSAHSSSAALRANLAETLPASSVRLHDGLHSKYIIIDGGGTAQGRRVLTGSHNLTGPALRSNDEAILEIEDAALTDTYLANWTKIWDQGYPQ